MGLIVVANTKGGAGKTTATIHLIAPWVYSRTGKAKVVELDDENNDTSDFYQSKVESEQVRIGKETASFLAIEKLIEKSDEDLIVVDVGGNRTCDLCLRTLSENDEVDNIELFVIPVASSGRDVENAENTIAKIKSMFPDYSGRIVLVVTRALSEDEDVARRDNPEAFDLAESEDLGVPIILPQDRLFSGARLLGKNAWEIGDEAAELKKTIRGMKETARKQKDLAFGRQASRLSAILVAGERMHDYLNAQFEKLDEILDLSKYQSKQGQTQSMSTSASSQKEGPSSDSDSEDT